MKTRTAVFALVCAAQLAVPASLIVKHERTRAAGTPWRFQTAPVDPDDPFRGKYVSLRFAVENAGVPLAGDAGYVRPGARLYAELAADAAGFATLTRLHLRRPAGTEYLDVFAREQDDGMVTVRLPFDRYYLTEDRAPQVEREYAEAARAGAGDAYVEVRVRDGHAALVALVLNGKPVD